VPAVASTRSRQAGLNEDRKNFYVLLSVLARPGFGLPSALGTVPLAAAGFFLSALGFFGSRLLLFCPFAIAVLHLGHQRIGCEQ
jgi:hypothetical protein